MFYFLQDSSINQSINQNQLFIYTGAGTHAPIPMRIPVLRMLVVPVLGHCPVWGQWASGHGILRGRLQSTIPHRGSPLISIVGLFPSQTAILQVLCHAMVPCFPVAERTPLARHRQVLNAVYLPRRPRDMAKPSETVLAHNNPEVTQAKSSL